MPLAWPLSGWNDEQLFPLVHTCFPAWALLVLRPRWKWTARIALASTAGLAALYLGLFLGSDPDTLSLSDYASWQGVSKLLSTKPCVLPAWTHFICADLFVGRWMALDAAERRVPLPLMAPLVGFTYVFCPIGLLIYLSAIRPFFTSPGDSDIKTGVNGVKKNGVAKAA